MTQLPDSVAKLPDMAGLGNLMLSFDFKGLLAFQTVIYVFITFCGDFFSTLGTVLGVAGKATCWMRTEICRISRSLSW